MDFFQVEPTVFPQKKDKKIPRSKAGGKFIFGLAAFCPSPNAVIFLWEAKNLFLDFFDRTDVGQFGFKDLFEFAQFAQGGGNGDDLNGS